MFARIDPRFFPLFAVGVAAAAASCGMGAAPGGGADDLPTLGAGPYAKLVDEEGTTAAEEPYLVVDLSADLTDPAVRREEDGALRLWFSRIPRAGGSSEIWTARLESLADGAGPAAASLVAAEPWEAGHVRAPAVVEAGDRLLLFYQGGTSVGRAESRDGGVTWSDRREILPGAADPGVLVVDGVYFLYFTRPGEDGVFLALSHDGVTFSPLAEPVLRPRGAPDAFDAAWVGEPFPVGGRTAAGQLQIGLFYVGRSVPAGGDEPRHAIGYAGSFDGRTFERFARGDAVLEPGPPDERGPAALLFPSSGFLFFAERRGQTLAIAGAHHP